MTALFSEIIFLIFTTWTAEIGYFDVFTKYCMHFQLSSEGYNVGVSDDTSLFHKNYKNARSWSLSKDLF